MIVTNVYTLVDDASKAGVAVEGGKPTGSIELGGTRYVKNGFVSNIPEPSSLMLIMPSLGLLGWLTGRGAQSRRRSRVPSGAL